MKPFITAGIFFGASLGRSSRTGGDHAHGNFGNVPHGDQRVEEHPPEAPDRTAVPFEHGLSATANTPEGFISNLIQ